MYINSHVKLKDLAVTNVDLTDNFPLYFEEHFSQISSDKNKNVRIVLQQAFAVVQTLLPQRVKLFYL